MNLSQDHIASRVGSHIENRIGHHKYSMWFGESASFNYDHSKHCFVVGAANRFVADWIKQNFHDTLQEAVRQELDDSTNITVEVINNDTNNKSNTNQHKAISDKTDKTEIAKQRQPNNQHKQRPNSHSHSRPHSHLRHSLDDFIVGGSNELAFAAACRIANNEEDEPTVPLFIHGGCGLGKTHLLQGICNKITSAQTGKNNPKVLYTTGERFTNEYITAVRSNTLTGFRKRMRKLDLLAIDDIHFIANKQATQQEFLHSFDEIELGGAKLVLASDCHPKWIKQFSKALVSRCLRGMVVEVKEPDICTRGKLIAALARRKNIFIKEPIVQMLANRCAGSVREIEGILNQLVALCSLRSPSVKKAQTSLKNNIYKQLEVDASIINQLFNCIPTTRNKLVRFDDILKAVSDSTKVSSSQIIGRSRQKKVVTARSLTIYLTRELTTMSYPEIAAAMGKNNHSSAVEAVKRIKSKIKNQQNILISSDEGEININQIIEQTKTLIYRRD